MCSRLSSAGGPPRHSRPNFIHSSNKKNNNLIIRLKPHVATDQKSPITRLDRTPPHSSLQKKKRLVYHLGSVQFQIHNRGGVCELRLGRDRPQLKKKSLQRHSTSTCIICAPISDIAFVNLNSGPSASMVEVHVQPYKSSYKFSAGEAYSCQECERERGKEKKNIVCWIINLAS